MGHQVAAQMLPDGMKSLAPVWCGCRRPGDEAGSGRPGSTCAQSLLDVIPVVPHASTEFAYMRQTVRTNLAAVVAEGAVKPTSVYTVTKVAEQPGGRRPSVRRRFRASG